MKKFPLTLITLAIVLSSCTSTQRAPSEEEQAMADALGITVEEMRALPDEEFTRRLNELEMDQSEG